MEVVIEPWLEGLFPALEKEIKKQKNEAKYKNIVKSGATNIIEISENMENLRIDENKDLITNGKHLENRKCVVEGVNSNNTNDKQNGTSIDDVKNKTNGLSVLHDSTIVDPETMDSLTYSSLLSDIDLSLPAVPPRFIDSVLTDKDMQVRTLL